MVRIQPFSLFKKYTLLKNWKYRKLYYTTKNLKINSPTFTLKFENKNLNFIINQMIWRNKTWKGRLIWSNTVNSVIKSIDWKNVTKKFKYLWIYYFINKILKKSKTYYWNLNLIHTKFNFKSLKNFNFSDLWRVRVMRFTPVISYSKSKNKKLRALKKKLKKKL